LHLDRVADGLHDTGKLDQQSIAHGLDDVAVMGGDGRVDHIRSKGLEGSKRGLFVDPHEAAVADHIGSYDGDKSSLDTCHGCLLIPELYGVILMRLLKPVQQRVLGLRGRCCLRACAIL
jgi:hypothetical protein